MAEESKAKWEGKATVEVVGEGTSAEQVWPLLQDFFNAHKWIPLDTCYQVDEVQGKPGLTRYCASTAQGIIFWVKERLLAIDPLQHCFSYEVVDSNMGFNSYVATIKVLPIDAYDSKVGCKIEWAFVSDPVQGWTFDHFNSHIHSSLNFMANKIHLALCPCHSSN